MAYREGSMGLAILAGMGIFVLVDMLLGFAFSGGFFGGYSLLMGPLGSGFSGLFSGYVSATNLVLDIIIPLVCGVIAGILARGSTSRGFIAGLAGTIIGYFIAFLMSFLAFNVLMANPYAGLNAYTGVDLSGFTGLTNSASVGIPVAQIMPGGLGTNAILYYVLALLVIPIIIGVVGGIGGAIMSAVLASPAPELQQAYAPMQSTTFVQAPMPYMPPPMVISQAPAQQYPSAPPAKIICPACKTPNESTSMFCLSCGTRLKS